MRNDSADRAALVDDIRVCRAGSAIIHANIIDNGEIARDGRSDASPQSKLRSAGAARCARTVAIHPESAHVCHGIIRNYGCAAITADRNSVFCGNNEIVFNGASSMEVNCVIEMTQSRPTSRCTEVVYEVSQNRDTAYPMRSQNASPAIAIAGVIRKISVDVVNVISNSLLKRVGKYQSANAMAR